MSPIYSNVKNLMFLTFILLGSMQNAAAAEQKRAVAPAQQSTTMTSTSRSTSTKPVDTAPVDLTKKSIAPTRPAITPISTSITNTRVATPSRSTPLPPANILKPVNGRNTIVTRQTSKKPVSLLKELDLESKSPYEKLSKICQLYYTGCDKEYFDKSFMTNDLVASDFARYYTKMKKEGNGASVTIGSASEVSEQIYSGITQNVAEQLVLEILSKNAQKKKDFENYLKKLTAPNAFKNLIMADLTIKNDAITYGLAYIKKLIDQNKINDDTKKGQGGGGANPVGGGAIPPSGEISKEEICANQGGGGGAPMGGEKGSGNPYGTTIDPAATGPKIDTMSGKKDWNSLGAMAPCQAVNWPKVLGGGETSFGDKHHDGKTYHPKEVNSVSEGMSKADIGGGMLLGVLVVSMDYTDGKGGSLTVAEHYLTLTDSNGTTVVQDSYKTETMENGNKTETGHDVMLKDEKGKPMLMGNGKPAIAKFEDSNSTFGTMPKQGDPEAQKKLDEKLQKENTEKEKTEKDKPETKKDGYTNPNDEGGDGGNVFNKCQEAAANATQNCIMSFTMGSYDKPKPSNCDVYGNPGTPDSTACGGNKKNATAADLDMSIFFNSPTGPGATDPSPEKDDNF